ncbi:hypothetical protein Pint_20782 [Pistacia integerrima]|uniref:Uncharacterized protein n=1 Tax=Pistacia integerrima TaxID=434235 RepID=A0ACC0X9I6_9ROSI|nr:hypothetical protein Pint_20782 [Pistacia integerrima]
MENGQHYHLNEGSVIYLGNFSSASLKRPSFEPNTLQPSSKKPNIKPPLSLASPRFLFPLPPQPPHPHPHPLSLSRPLTHLQAILYSDAAFLISETHSLHKRRLKHLSRPSHRMRTCSCDGAVEYDCPKRRKIQELKTKSASDKGQPGLLQFGSSTSEILETAFKEETVDLVTREEYVEKVDAVHCAFNAMGFKDVEIVVAETGWPYRGDPNEVGPSVENANDYNGNLSKM